jgi:acetyltransferase-like isoleucine patch superfamily enzyme
VIEPAWRYARRRWREARARARLERELRGRYPTLSMEPGVDLIRPERLTLGSNVGIHRGVVLHCGGLDWSFGEGSISIGDDSVISAYCVLFGAGHIEIGRGFDCGPGTMIFSSRSDYVANGAGASPRHHVFAPVRIGDYVTVFARCVIGPGVTIGDGAAIAAGSVVLDDVEPHFLYAGTPARKIRTIERPS